MQKLVHGNGIVRRGMRRFVPNYYAKTVHDIDFAHLKSQGITHVAVDIDGTLVPNDGIELHTETVLFFREERDKGNILKLAIATNRPKQKIGNIGDAMHADVIFHAKGLYRKPLGRYYADLLEKLGSAPEQTAMIGDKLIQDIAGGNAAGLTTVLVDPLSPVMFFERWLFKMVQGSSDKRTIPRELLP